MILLKTMRGREDKTASISIAAGPASAEPGKESARYREAMSIVTTLVHSEDRWTAAGRGCHLKRGKEHDCAQISQSHWATSDGHRSL